MEAIFDEAGGRSDTPHRHDYYTVLFITKAKGYHFIDYKSYEFQDLQVHFVAPGQVHQVELKERPKGHVLTFSRDFLTINAIPDSFISNINLFRPFGEAPPLLLDQTTFDRLVRIISEMETCMPLELKYRIRALGASLQLFLIYCNNSSELNTSQLDEENASVCILRDFKNMVDHKYPDWHKVKDYASELHITSKHLSQTVKNITGKTAKELIQERLMLEAKRLLLHTGMSVKEIAYEVGFEEPLHFSGFFKKIEGDSPSNYRILKRPL